MSAPLTYDPAPLVRLYHAATANQRRAGMAWYREGAAWSLSVVGAASGHRLNRAQCAAIVALLSPRCSWRENVRRAVGVAERLRDGRDPGAVPGAFAYARPLLRRACRAGIDPVSCFEGREDSGPKTWAFYRNLTGNLAPVTVDVWAARAVGAPASLDLPTYRAVESAYVGAAHAIGDAPASVQAVVWVVVRGAPGRLTYQRTLAFPGASPILVA